MDNTKVIHIAIGEKVSIERKQDGMTVEGPATIVIVREGEGNHHP